MPLTPREVIARTADLTELVALINEALKKDKDGKVRLTGNEAWKIGRKMLDIGWKLIRDCLD